MGVADDQQAAADAFMSKYGLTYPVISDPGGIILMAWGVKGVPTTVFLDSRRGREGAPGGRLDTGAVRVGAAEGPVDQDGREGRRGVTESAALPPPTLAKSSEGRGRPLRQSPRTSVYATVRQGTLLPLTGLLGSLDSGETHERPGAAVPPARVVRPHRRDARLRPRRRPRARRHVGPGRGHPRGRGPARTLAAARRRGPSGRHRRGLRVDRRRPPGDELGRADGPGRHGRRGRGERRRLDRRRAAGQPRHGAVVRRRGGGHGAQAGRRRRRAALATKAAAPAAAASAEARAAADTLAVAAAYRSAHPDESEALDTCAAVVPELVRGLADALRRVPAGADDKARAEALGAVRALEGALSSARAEVGALDEHFRAWRAGTIAQRLEDYEFLLELDTLVAAQALPELADGRLRSSGAGDEANVGRHGRGAGRLRGAGPGRDRRGRPRRRRSRRRGRPSAGRGERDPRAPAAARPAHDLRARRRRAARQAILHHGARHGRALSPHRRAHLQDPVRQARRQARLLGRQRARLAARRGHLRGRRCGRHGRLAAGRRRPRAASAPSGSSIGSPPCAAPGSTSRSPC